MNSSDIIIGGVFASIWVVTMVFVARYLWRKNRECEALIKKGWRMVGCTFIGGPILMPPPDEKERG